MPQRRTAGNDLGVQAAGLGDDVRRDAVDLHGSGDLQRALCASLLATLDLAESMVRRHQARRQMQVVLPARVGGALRRGAFEHVELLLGLAQALGRKAVLVGRGQRSDRDLDARRGKWFRIRQD